MNSQLIIWQFSDQKPGHENQAKGLINALKNRTKTESHKVLVPLSLFSFLLSVISGRFHHQLAQLPPATHLLAVGRRTHLPMLLAKLWFGGKRIVLMHSHWPKRWFDAMIIPKHDNPKQAPNVLITQGVINNVTPSGQHDEHSRIILIGGPSKHYHWDDTSVISQIKHLIHSTMPITSWQIANSRRTPASFFERLNSEVEGVTFIDHKTVDSNWLPEQLTKAGQVWVTPDSVSMVYESITSGAQVGCFTLLEKQADNRIVSGINELLEQHKLTSFEQWQAGQSLSSPPHPLFEAQRAADWILKQ